ncbi:MAG: cytidine deaminase [Candidatus Bathyarchaeota archaeon]|nr:cytidine deaminase [Candidatus Bathyarchaeota archaeon]
MGELGKVEAQLLDAAFRGMENAFVLWGFAVGAAVLAEDGKVYEGANVESWISGLGTCAERNAINHALIHGNRKIKAVAVVLSSEYEGEAVPCGVCLQHIFDFAENAQIKVIAAKADLQRVLFGTVQVQTLQELLPFPYKKRAFSP